MSQRDIKSSLYSSESAIRGRKLDGGRARAEQRRGFQEENDHLHYLPCIDSTEQAERARQLRNIPRQQTAAMGKETMTALMTGRYTTATGQPVDWRAAVQAAIHAKRSLPPDAPLPATPRRGSPAPASM